MKNTRPVLSCYTLKLLIKKIENERSALQRICPSNMMGFEPMTVRHSKIPNFSNFTAIWQKVSLKLNHFKMLRLHVKF